MRPYEGMWVVHNKESRKDLDYLESHVEELVSKAGGRLVSLRKWDDRKLAYEINSQSHGLYYLTYFEGEIDTVTKLRHEVRLSDLVLRALFLSIESFPEFRAPEDTEADSGAETATESPATESPATESPATESPATESPATESPAAESPAADGGGEAPVAKDATAEASGGSQPAEQEAATVSSDGEPADKAGEKDAATTPQET